MCACTLGNRSFKHSGKNTRTAYFQASSKPRRGRRLRILIDFSVCLRNPAKVCSVPSVSTRGTIHFWVKVDSVRLERIWRSRPPFWLRGLAGIYALGWRVYEGAYRVGLKQRVWAPVPVVGVGSVWVGGVGKTPVTIAIARLLHESGRRVAVLTHGYGGSRYRETTLVEPYEEPDPAAVGDEAAELHLALPEIPIAVGKWRVRTAQAALARWSPEVLILDDGFQHLPLARTLDLVLLPAESPLGNGYCLPAGPLREPPSGLRRAGGVVMVGMEAQPQRLPDGEWGGGVPFRCKGKPLYYASVVPTALLDLRTGTRLPLDALQNRPLQLLCGIARPERFVQTAQSLGYIIERVHTYRDHHAYTPQELRFLSGKTALTTAKDAVKLRTVLPQDCDAYVLLLEAHLDGAITQRLLQL
ncbi:MAG: tetraacyldisaccharide 4'-kinase [Armatimonadetes bacterium JP3_11]|nr:MAG: tetraacyldisaccharide 4'-kinase [Armatimonadetes bacterium JP3_11]